VDDEALKVYDFLRTSDAEPLAPFESPYERSGLEKTLVCAHIEPRETAPRLLYFELLVPIANHCRASVGIAVEMIRISVNPASISILKG
jgi:hypothetical protein